MSNYQYPFDLDWSKQEIVEVIQFFTKIEKAYESGIQREDLLKSYQRFKEIVPSKSEEKQYFQEFQKESGYSSYHAVKTAREGNEKIIKMK
ncbi:UPF0223 family protein [Ornithinibacillus halophilus]|uniref:UPF0223 protein SAMN05216225_10015 n=1 Tax=Ornithinibacillus halophilus TaxID=930117 RepID=A0A1M5C129_9BACI|nr:UPF0223 family protein [Ornithinibacillus halophilus]SHF48317.1 Uncharacterized protein YktA, UPF0223 family [Ornithinibacillus halophilus]